MRWLVQWQLHLALKAKQVQTQEDDEMDPEEMKNAIKYGVNIDFVSP